MGEDVLKSEAISGYSQGLRSYTPPEKRSNINAICVKIGSITFFYSYQTLIAISQGRTAIVRENLWGAVTGKHIGYARQYFNSNTIGYHEVTNERFVNIMVVIAQFMDRVTDRGENNFLEEQINLKLGTKVVPPEVATAIGNFNPVINNENIGLVSGG